jgi:hypothetical protein
VGLRTCAFSDKHKLKRCYPCLELIAFQIHVKNISRRSTSVLWKKTG